MLTETLVDEKKDCPSFVCIGREEKRKDGG